MNHSPLAKSLVISIGLTLSFMAEQAFAVCTTLVKGPVAIDVKSCSAVAPEATFRGDSKYNFIRDLPPANRKQFLGTYRGSLVSGTVTQSQAIRDGISDEKGALLNERISAFIPANQSSCDQVNGKLIEVVLNQTCCDGGGASPCLLDTGYVLNQIKVSGTSAKAGAKKPSDIQALYTKARGAAAIKDFKQSAALFEQIRTRGELDVFGQFQLGLVYREMDKCNQALALLEPLHQKFEKKDMWTDTEAPIRKGSFLYARCLAVLGRASESTLVLQGFLVERQKYRKEIKDSLGHRDFGYIRTSKPWMKYKKAAEAALIAPPDQEENAEPSPLLP